MTVISKTALKSYFSGIAKSMDASNSFSVFEKKPPVSVRGAWEKVGQELSSTFSTSKKTDARK